MVNSTEYDLHAEAGLQLWRDWIEEALQRFSQSDHRSPEILTSAMRYTLLGGGKRLRPILTLAACEACGGDPASAVPAACAVEMIHAYSLIHDDLPGMDNDDMRRGRPTCHIQFNHATAILAGDSLQSRAFEILATELCLQQHNDSGPVGTAQVSTARVSTVRALRCVAILAAAAGPCGMAGGQQDDLMAESLPQNESTLQRIHSRKTGALLQAALEMGAVIAGGTDLQLEKLRTFGHNIGLAFQVVDDLLDVTSDASTIGKRTQKDQDQGKLTYPALFGIEESRRMAAALIDQAVDCLRPFGSGASRLQSIARFVLERRQ